MVNGNCSQTLVKRDGAVEGEALLAALLSNIF